MWEISRHLETKILRFVHGGLHGGNFAKSSNISFFCCKHPFPSPIDDEMSNHQQMESILILVWGSQK
jgi:hypothetical protein